MKKFLFFAAIAALAVISCNPDTADESTKVKKTHTIKGTPDDPPVRTALAEDGLTINWEGTESIGVFDGIDTAPNKFDAESAGATTDFSGEISVGATNLLVFYPYQSTATCDMSASTITLNIPAVQNAVKGGFDPAAAVSAATATTTDEAVYFRNFFALVKVEVDIDNVTSLRIENTSRSFAGDAILAVASRGISNGANTSKTVTLKKSDDSALEQGVYYFVIRSCTAENPYKGFALSVATSTGATGVRTAVNDFVIARNQVKSIGKLSSITLKEPAAGSRYAQYMAGNDLVIGGTTYNKATHGEAVLLEPKNLGGDNLNGAGNVVFLSPGTYTTGGEAKFTHEIVVVGDIPNDDPVITTSAKVWNLGGSPDSQASLICSHLTFDLSGVTGSQFLTNKTSTADAKKLVLEDCVVKNCPRYLFQTNGANMAYGINEILINRCVLQTNNTNAPALFNLTKNMTNPAAYKKFTMTNTVAYHTNPTTEAGPLVGWFMFNFLPDQSEALDAADWPMEMNLSNNIFYNIASNSSNARNYAVKTLTLKNNLVVCPGYVPANGQKLYTQRIKTNLASIFTPDYANNAVYASQDSDPGNWIIADDAFTKDFSFEKKLTFLTENPLETADLTNGIFKVKSAYSSYGPQL